MSWGSGDMTLDVGVIITMYDEYDIVMATIDEVRLKYPDSKIVVVKSDSGDSNPALDSIISAADKFEILSDLSKEYGDGSYPARAISRNLGRGFTLLSELGKFDITVAMTGDTLITDANSFNRRFDDLSRRDAVAAISQAWGQRFHGENLDGSMKTESRLQGKGVADFACCLFFTKGDFVERTGVFKEIPVTNKFSSEQCLGDELVSKLPSADFRKYIILLNEKSPQVAYSYSDGARYHARTSGRPGR